MNAFFQQIQQLWARQGFLGKMVLGGATVALLVAVVGVGFWANYTSYAVLFSGLPTEEAAAITQKLDADRTVYKLSSDGTTILVPADRVQKTRMGLAVAGLLQGTEKGFEIFDTMNFGATPFVQNMNYVRAIQGELAKTIMTLDVVSHARVHLVQPESSPFIRDEKPTTASVVIKTRPGVQLSRAITQGIVALVAGSVKGLSTENVTVLDTEGRVLSEKKRSAQGMVSTEQLSHQVEVETRLSEKAQEILTRLLGPGRAVVRVTADMSFKHLKETSEKFDPEGKVVARESIVTSKATSATGPKGPAGTASNLPPGGAAAAGAASGPNSSEEVLESDYLNSVINRTLEEQQETINRLTVAVMLIPPVPVDETPLEESLGVSVVEVEKLVRQAVGYKDGRDQIQVSVGKAPNGPAEAAIEQQIVTAQNWENYGNVAKASSLGIAGLSLLAIGLLSLRGKRAPSPTTPAPAFATGGTASNNDLNDLNAIAGTIKAWLEEPASIRLDRSRSQATR